MIFFQVQKKLSQQLYELGVLLSAHYGTQIGSRGERNLSLSLVEYVSVRVFPEFLQKKATDLLVEKRR